MRQAFAGLIRRADALLIEQFVCCISICNDERTRERHMLCRACARSGDV